MLCCSPDALGSAATSGSRRRLEGQVSSTLDSGIRSRTAFGIRLVLHFSPKVLDGDSLMCYQDRVDKLVALVYTVNFAYSSPLTFCLSCGRSGVSVVH